MYIVAYKLFFIFLFVCLSYIYSFMFNVSKLFRQPRFVFVELHKLLYVACQNFHFDCDGYSQSMEKMLFVGEICKNCCMQMKT